MERLGTPDRKGILAYLKPMSPEDMQKQREQEAKDRQAAREFQTKAIQELADIKNKWGVKNMQLPDARKIGRPSFQNLWNLGLHDAARRIVWGKEDFNWKEMPGAAAGRHGRWTESEQGRKCEIEEDVGRRQEHAEGNEQEAGNK